MWFFTRDIISQEEDILTISTCNTNASSPRGKHIPLFSRFESIRVSSYTSERSRVSLHDIAFYETQNSLRILIFLFEWRKRVWIHSYLKKNRFKMNAILFSISSSVEKKKFMVIEEYIWLRTRIISRAYLSIFVRPVIYEAEFLSLLRESTISCRSWVYIVVLRHRGEQDDSLPHTLRRH